MATKTPLAKTSKAAKPAQQYESVHGGIVDLLQSARVAAARSVNALMTASYWEIGRRISGAEQKSRSDIYGKQLIQELSVDLTQQFGRGFGVVNLSQMRAFYQLWPVEKIFQTLSEKSFLPTPTLPELAKAFPLPWSAYVAMLSVKNEQARAFYEAEALRGGWSVRQLDRQINTQFFERTALSRNKAAMLTKGMKAKPEDVMTVEEVVKDPFVLELGDDFTFVGRQKRLRLDDTWFRVDLTFFHRTLRWRAYPARCWRQSIKRYCLLRR